MGLRAGIAQLSPFFNQGPSYHRVADPILNSIRIAILVDDERAYWWGSYESEESENDDMFSWALVF